MHRKTPLLLAGALGAAAFTHAALAKPTNQALFDELCRTIRDNYVFPEIGEKLAAHIAERADSGVYEGLSRQDLAAALTRDLQEFTNDRHFSAGALPEGWTPPQESEAEIEEPFDPRVFAPFGVQKVERLAGNIGYLDLRGFHPAEFANETIISAVRLLQGSSTIILDLRRNGGGDPATVQTLCSYFFDPAEPVHLNSLYFRPTDETREFWTQPEYPDLAMPDTPIFVLTSSYTFSGGEECAYNLKTRKRATLVGETTGGGAHPVDGFPVANTIMLRVPVGRAINPVTGTNWEGTGVAPEVAVPADDALDTALEMALQRLAASGNPAAEWGLYQHAMQKGGIEVSADMLGAYVGDFTDREIGLENGSLQYRRKGAPVWRALVPVGDGVFMIDGMEDFRLEFERAGGAIVAVRGVYQQRDSDRSVKAE